MKQLLLFFLFIFSSFIVYSQVQGPPAPLGYIVYHKCDLDGNGIEEFNLSSHFIFPFSVEGEEASNYYPLTFYLTADDRDNEINPIVNPTAYINLSKTQPIYYRTYAIVPDSYEYLDGSSKIVAEAIPSPNRDNKLVVCDNNIGENIFSLTLARNQILSGQDSELYTLNYYETLIDAENEANVILNLNSYTNSVNNQTIYVRVYHSYAPTCYDIVELNLEASGVCQDLEIQMYSTRPPRPGFTNEYFIYAINYRYDSSISGRIWFNHESFIELVSVTNVELGETITNISNGFFLDIDNIAPRSQTFVTVKMSTPVSVPLGTDIKTIAQYLGTDYDLSNNYFELVERVVGSYDPNDIVESHGPEILHSSFDSDDYLYYTVRFQNVGTADAINVRIENTLDASLDPSTIVMLNSSHTNVFTRVGSQLTWQFDNIHLPSEDMDEPNSHGYVNYKIKPTTGYKVGDIIPNTAEIYFDFNPAVITNTFETEFVATLSDENINDSEFSIYPNPVNNLVELKFKNQINSSIEIKIFDVQGKLIIDSKNQLQNNTVQLNVASLKGGLYFLKVKDGINELTRKLIVE